jgi:hypothetical protein
MTAMGAIGVMRLSLSIKTPTSKYESQKGALGSKKLNSRFVLYAPTAWLMRTGNKIPLAAEHTT